MRSKITNGPIRKLFEETVLLKYKVGYYQCEETGFIQTDEAYWLKEAYSSAITKLDIGLVHRNLQVSDAFGKLLATHFNKHGRFLDFAGGYGLFTRLMRDKGFNFYHTDIYCQNIFAEHFDYAHTNPNEKFEAVTATEVFEHMNNPVDEIKALFNYSDTILFTTELQPKNLQGELKSWWYFSFETGQHIAFYTEETFQYLAKQFNCNFYSNGHSMHLLTRKTFNSNPFNSLKEPFLLRKLKKLTRKLEQKTYHYSSSLLDKDWDYVKKQLQQQENS